MAEIKNECPKCGCPRWRQESMRTCDAYSAWKDEDGTWYNGPAREDIYKTCAHCGWTQRVHKRRGKTVSVEHDET